MKTEPEVTERTNKDDGSMQPTMLGGVLDLLKGNMLDTIAYVILSLSLIWSFFSPFFGQLPVGTILGLYFSAKTFEIARQFREFLVVEGIFKGFVAIAAGASLVICAPGLVLGLAIGVFVAPLLPHHDESISS